MCRLEVVEHEVHGVRGCADKDDLKDSVIQRVRVVEGPEKVNVSSKVDNQVQKLRLERDTGRALFDLSDAAQSKAQFDPTYTGGLHLVQKNEDRQEMGQVPYTTRISMRRLNTISSDSPNSLKRFIVTTRPWLYYGLWCSAATRASLRIERLRDVE